MIHALLCLHAGPWPQLLDVTRELQFSTEIEGARGTSFKRAATSMAEIAERLRTERRTSSATATLGSLASLGGSLGASLGDKLSASQFTTGTLQACIVSVNYSAMLGSLAGSPRYSTRASSCSTWVHRLGLP